MEREKLMNIYAPKGHKVTITESSIKNGSNYWREQANKFLKVGAVYTVEKIDVRGFSSTVFLQEFPEQPFNTVNFVDAEI